MEQAPCPDRIIDDVGSAFLLGGVGHGLISMISGMRNSPKGMKFYGGIQTVALKAPVTGGAFAVWGGLFATFDCGLASVRRTEDSWNAIFAGGLTGGVLAMRAGAVPAAKGFAVGFALLGLIETCLPLMTKMMSGQPEHGLLEQVDKVEERKVSKRKLEFKKSDLSDEGSMLGRKSEAEMFGDGEKGSFLALRKAMSSSEFIFNAGEVQSKL